MRRHHDRVNKPNVCIVTVADRYISPSLDDILAVFKAQDEGALVAPLM